MLALIISGIALLISIARLVAIARRQRRLDRIYQITRDLATLERDRRREMRRTKS